MECVCISLFFKNLLAFCYSTENSTSMHFHSFTRRWQCFWLLCFPSLQAAFILQNLLVMPMPANAEEAKECAWQVCLHENKLSEVNINITAGLKSSVDITNLSMVISGFLSNIFTFFFYISSFFFLVFFSFLCLPEPLRAWWGFWPVSGRASCPAGSVVPLPVFWERGPDGEELLHGQTCLHPQPPSSPSQCHPGYGVHVPRALPAISGCLTRWHPYAYTHY